MSQAFLRPALGKAVAGWLGRHRLPLLAAAFVYAAHLLCYLWVMAGMETVYNSRFIAAQMNVLLNGLLAPTLLFLLMHLLAPARPLALAFIVVHHLLFLGACLLFAVYHGYYQALPTLHLFGQAGQLPFIFWQVILQLMGAKEWLTLLLVCASLVVTLCWASALAWTQQGRHPWIASALLLLLASGYWLKSEAVSRVAVDARDKAAFEIYGFLPYIKKQLAFYFDSRQLEPVAWPGKVNPGIAAEARPRDLKNVLVIQVESLDKWVIDYAVGGREVMPNLRRLKGQSLYFGNFFAQHEQGGSSDAELAALTSLLPQRYPAFKSPSLSLAPSLARVLAAHGYHAVGMHGHTGRFWNRSTAYHWLGFHRFVERKSYTGDAAGGDSKDLAFFQQSLPMLQALPEPFFAYLITMQSHGPFRNYAEDAQPFNPPGPLGFPDTMERYLRSMHEVDAALGFLWRGLRQAGLLERTLVFLYGDHPSYVVPRRCIHHECVPLLIHAPGLAAGTSPHLGSHLDIAPTVLALLGIAEPPKQWLGSSLLGTGPRRVVFRDGFTLHRTADGRLARKQDGTPQPFIAYSHYLLNRLAAPTP